MRLFAKQKMLLFYCKNKRVAFEKEAKPLLLLLMCVCVCGTILKILLYRIVTRAVSSSLLAKVFG